MITGTHVLFYSANPEADRAFLRDVLQFQAVDAGHGWLIFALPPAEAGIHPIDEHESRPTAQGGHSLLGAEIYLMCDDLQAEIKRLQTKNVECAPVETAPWGSKTALHLPSGGTLGLYQPRHPTAIGLKRRSKSGKGVRRKVSGRALRRRK